MNKREINIFSGTVFFVMFSYAVIRYNLGKGVGFSQTLFYVLNKAFAYFSLFNFGMLAISGRLFESIWGEKTKKNVNYFTKLGLFSVFCHVSMSMVLFNHHYFPHLVEETGRLSLFGSLSLLFSILALSILVFINLKLIKQSKNLRILLILFTIFHLIFLGFHSWSQVLEWPWYLPPISLLAFIDSVIIFYFSIKNKTKEKNKINIDVTIN